MHPTRRKKEKEEQQRPSMLAVVRSRNAAALVVRSIADDSSIELFRTIALEKDVDGKKLKSRTTLTQKKYYLRLSRMRKVGLVRKSNSRYILTTLGKVVYESHAIVQTAAVNYWKLKAIDSLKMSNEFSKEQQQKIVSLLLDNQELKDSLPK